MLGQAWDMAASHSLVVRPAERCRQVHDVRSQLLARSRVEQPAPAEWRTMTQNSSCMPLCSRRGTPGVSPSCWYTSHS